MTLHAERLSQAEAQAEVIYAWRDPENMALVGLGCHRCHVRPPVVFGLPFGALCDACLERTLAPWAWERIEGWLVRQRGVKIRQGERRAVLRTWSPSNLGPALAYERKYGVWLLEYPHPWPSI